MSAATHVLRLYVAGMTPQSLRTLDAVQNICDQLAPESVDLEVIDLLVAPDAAEQDKVVATPTLVKVRPLPVVWIMGDLLNVDNVRRLLMTVEAAPHHARLRVATCAALPRD